MPAWNEGGKEESLDRFGVSMSHADLESALGTEVTKTIEDAGFVLVPRRWRDGTLASLSAPGVRLAYSELNLVRQWFNATEDAAPGCIEDADRKLMALIMLAIEGQA